MYAKCKADRRLLCVVCVSLRALFSRILLCTASISALPARCTRPLPLFIDHLVANLHLAVAQTTTRACEQRAKASPEPRPSSGRVKRPRPTCNSTLVVHLATLSFLPLIGMSDRCTSSHARRFSIGNLEMFAFMQTFLCASRTGTNRAESRFGQSVAERRLSPRTQRPSTGSEAARTRCTSFPAIVKLRVERREQDRVAR